MKWLDAMKVPSMVIGGVAASVLGEPRLTQDVDALAIVPETEWGSALAGAATFGIVPRIKDALEFASVRLPRVEDLLIMKAIARRPKDLQDIRGLLAAHPDADVALVRRWVGEFATAMSMPDMLEEFEKLVVSQNPKR
jgi:hypothetical protein